MKDGKEMEMCQCGHSHGMGGKHLYMVIGTVSIVYGLMMWAGTMYMWAPYVGWIVGGVLLIVIGWLKKMIWMHKGM